MVWKNPVGLGKTIRGDMVKFGVKGSADILGVVGPYGKFIALEIKTGRAVQNREQVNYERVMTDIGALYFVVRNEEDLGRIYDFCASHGAKP